LVLRSHFAVGLPAALWFSIQGRAGRRLRYPNHRSRGASLSSRVFLGVPSQPRRRSGQPAPLMGFCSLQHLPDLGVHVAAGLPHPLRSAFRVSLPSWRFAPPEPWSALSHADSAPGIQPFEAFSSRKVPRMFPSEMNPPAVYLPLLRRTNPSGDPTGRDFWASTLPGVPRWACEANTDRQPVAPLGFRPFQG
jgi:hypothetical protein